MVRTSLSNIGINIDAIDKNSAISIKFHGCLN